MFCQGAGLPQGLQSRPCWVQVGAHLLCVLLLHGLEVGAQVHRHLVLRAQQGAQHGVRGDAHPPQRGALELPAQVQHLELQVLDLRGAGGSGLRARPLGTPVTTATSWTDTYVPSSAVGTEVGGSRTGKAVSRGGHTRMCPLEAPFGLGGWARPPIPASNKSLPVSLQGSPVRAGPCPGVFPGRSLRGNSGEIHDPQTRGPPPVPPHAPLNRFPQAAHPRRRSPAPCIPPTPLELTPSRPKLREH